VNRKPGQLASGALVLYMGVLSAWAWPQIPAGARIAIHWNAAGSPNGYAGKLFGLLFVPLLGVAILLLAAVIPQLEPRRLNLWQSARAYNVLWTAFTAVLSIVHSSVLLNAVGRSVNPRFLGVGVVGVLLIVLGNYLGKVRSNFSWASGHRGRFPANCRGTRRTESSAGYGLSWAWPSS
jgi:uncharacterized membrane protein